MSWKDAAYNITVFGFFVNAAVVAMQASGYFRTLGVELSPLSSVENINQGLSSFEPSQGIQDTIFAILNVLGGIFGLIPDFLFAFPNIFYQLGVDGWMVTLIFAPQYLLWFAALMYLFSGRRF